MNLRQPFTGAHMSRAKKSGRLIVSGNFVLLNLWKFIGLWKIGNGPFLLL